MTKQAKELGSTPAPTLMSTGFRLKWLVELFFIFIFKTNLLKVCGAGDGYGAAGGDSMLMAISKSNFKINGGWCDWFATETRKFICKALI